MIAQTARVSVTGKHVIHSTKAGSIPDPFILGPFDQVYHFSTPVKVIHIYESPEHEKLVPLPRLKQALELLLERYPHLTGRLRVDRLTGVRSIVGMSTGMHLVDARCEATLKSYKICDSKRDMTLFDLPHEGANLMPPWGFSLEEAEHQPLFIVQRTEFACSAVSIGICVSHSVCGAGGTLRLYQDFAALYRALADGTATKSSTDLPEIHPFMADKMPSMDDEERASASTFQPSTFWTPAIDTHTETDAETEHRSHIDQRDDPVSGRTLIFKPEALAMLKARAADPASKTTASTFVALIAHLWKRIQIARLSCQMCCEYQRELFSESPFTSNIALLGHLSLSPRTFGNTVISPFVNPSTMTLIAQSSTQTADLVSTMIKSVSKEEAYATGLWIAAQAQTSASAIRFRFPVKESSLITTGWHRFPMYSGAGLDVLPTLASPVAMGKGSFDFDGGLIVFEGRKMDGGLECILSLRQSTWHVLDSDKHFSEVLS